MTKATVDRADLRNALGIITRITAAKSKIPVLTQVRLSVNGDVELAATNYDVAAVLKLKRQNRGGEFQALLPAQRLAECVRTSKCETVSFQPAEGNSTVLEGIGARLVGLDVNDFPATLGEEGSLLATFAAGELAEALRTVQFAISTEVVRYALTGVLFEVKRGQGALVASDGKRLAVSRLKVGNARDARVILSWQAAELLERLASKADPAERVDLRATFAHATDVKTGEKSESPILQQLHLTVGKYAGIYARPVEGHFPDWELVVPSNVDKVFEVDRKALTGELERVRQACTDKTLATRFTFKGGKLELFSKTPDVGEASAEVQVKGAAEVVVVFNPEYVLDFLKAQAKSVERVTIRVRDKNGAAVFEATKGNRYVLMPLTITL